MAWKSTETGEKWIDVFNIYHFFIWFCFWRKVWLVFRLIKFYFKLMHGSIFAKFALYSKKCNFTNQNMEWSKLNKTHFRAKNKNWNSFRHGILQWNWFFWFPKQQLKFENFYSTPTQLIHSHSYSNSCNYENYWSFIAFLRECFLQWRRLEVDNRFLI